MRKSIVWASLLIAVGIPEISHAASVKILTPSQPAATSVVWGPAGNASNLWPFFSRQFDLVTYAALGAPGAISGADVYLVNAIAGGGTAGATFTGEELANLSALIHSSSRGAILFEWAPAWLKSNLQLATITGGTAESLNPISPILNAEGASMLVSGVTDPLHTGFAGGISGGERVFGNVITIVGAHQNIVLIGDVQIIENSYTSVYPGNLKFGSNLADFLAVPEPGSLITATLGMFLCSFRRRRR